MDPNPPTDSDITYDLLRQAGVDVPSDLEDSIYSLVLLFDGVPNAAIHLGKDVDVAQHAYDVLLKDLQTQGANLDWRIDFVEAYEGVVMSAASRSHRGDRPSLMARIELQSAIVALIDDLDNLKGAGPSERRLEKALAEAGVNKDIASAVVAGIATYFV